MPLGGGSWSVLGSTLFFSGPVMLGRSNSTAKQSVPRLFSPSEWKGIVATLHLSPRQADVVELMLRGQRDKQIAESLGVRVSTVRMHLRHIFARLQVHDRMELAIRVFATLRQADKRRRHS